MKWIKCLCRAVAFVAFAPASHTRTVQPVTYSYKTTNDGVYTATFQEGVHRIFDNTGGVSSSTPLSIHPSVLAHHYYDRPPEAATTYAFFTNISSTTPRSKKPVRKKNDYVPRVSYIHQPEETTTVDYGSTTEPMMRKVRPRRKGRPKNRNEIPVNEELTTESAVVNGHGTQSSVSEDERSAFHEPEPDTGRPESFFNLLSTTESAATTEDERQPKPFGISTSASVETTSKNTRKPTQSGRKVNSSRSQVRGKQRKHKENGVAAARTEPPTEAPSITTEGAETENEREHSEDGNDENGDDEIQVTANRRKGEAGEEVPNVGRKNNKRRRSRKPKTTPLPKYKEAYLRRPRKKTKTTASHDAGRVAGSSNRRYEKERMKLEDSATLTTDQPFTSTDEGNMDMDRESESEPGTHHESLQYTDTEKTDVIRQDIEYPDDDEPSEGEGNEPKGENSDHPPAAKTLQKPLRYAYSEDQAQSASHGHGDQGHSDQAGDEKKSKGGGENHKESHHETEGEKKAEEHESKEEYEKGKKGHSDEEERKHDHEEMKGKKKNHKTEAGHYGHQHVVSKGEKEALFGESGAHKKGHSTKGR